MVFAHLQQLDGNDDVDLGDITAGGLTLGILPILLRTLLAARWPKL